MTDIRVTRQGLEVVTPIVSSPVSRVTRQGLEVLTSHVGAPVSQVTRMAMEVLVVIDVGAPAVLGTRREMITITYT